MRAHVIEGNFISARTCSAGKDLGWLSIQIQKGRIARILRGKRRGAIVLDDSLWLAPGLIDLQVNGGFGIDLLKNPHRLNALSENLPTTGVLRYLVALPSAPKEAAIRVVREVLSQRSRVRGGSTETAPVAEVVGVHLEGPLLNPERRGAHPRTRLLAGAKALDYYGEIFSLGSSKQSGVVKMVTLAPEMEGALEVASLANRHRVVVAAGHTDATYDDALQAIKRNINVFTHIFNACRPMHHRDPGVAAAYLLHPSTTLTLICDGVHVSAPMVRLLVSLVGVQRIALVTDAVSGLGTRQSSNSKAAVRARAATDSTGRLVGGTTPLSVCVANLARFSGCSFPEALYSASGVPARILNLADRGSLRVGSPARMVAISDSGSVHAVIQRSYLFELSLS